jgi:hypothetical protein
VKKQTKYHVWLRADKTAAIPSGAIFKHIGFSSSYWCPFNSGVFAAI